MKPKTIVLPLDLSDLSFEAIPEAVELARRFDSVLELMHVVEEDPILQAYGPAEGFTTDFSLQIEKSVAVAKERLSEAASSIEEEHGISTRILVVRGRATSEIVRAAGLHGDNLVVLNTHGRSGFETALIGSVTERVVRFSSGPVWVSRGTTLEGVRSVLCPLDFTEVSLSIIPEAVEVAETWGARISFLYVFDDSLLASLARGVLFPLSDPDRIDSHSIDKVRSLLTAEVKKRLPDLEPDQILIREGHPAATICEMSQETDLVIVGTHGRVGIARAVHGSVAERVTRGAESSVLVMGHP